MMIRVDAAQDAVAILVLLEHLLLHGIREELDVIEAYTLQSLFCWNTFCYEKNALY